MTDLLVRKHEPDAAGVVLEVTPKSAGWDHVGFKVHHLAAGQTATGGEAGREACLVVLRGTADVTVGDRSFAGLGGRASVFEDKAPGAVYAPGGAAWSVTA
jgi:5-deoxy-glucuronate isomerase